MQLWQPNYAKDPKKYENCNPVPRSNASRGSPSSSSPATTNEEDARHHPELEKAHRPLAFGGVKVDTRLGRRDEANGSRPSTGATPHPIQLLEPTSPMTDSTAEGKSRQIQPATVHIAQKLHRTQERGPTATSPEREDAPPALDTWTGDPPDPLLPWSRHWHQRKTPKGRGRDPGKLFPCAAAATVSPTPPGRCSRREASPRQTLQKQVTKS
jgi:hypothetical protein